MLLLQAPIRPAPRPHVGHRDPEASNLVKVVYLVVLFLNDTSAFRQFAIFALASDLPPERLLHLYGRPQLNREHSTKRVDAAAGVTRTAIFAVPLTGLQRSPELIQPGNNDTDTELVSMRCSRFGQSRGPRDGHFIELRCFPDYEESCFTLKRMTLAGRERCAFLA